jgi:hypothetical protein
MRVRNISIGLAIVSMTALPVVASPKGGPPAQGGNPHTVSPKSTPAGPKGTSTGAPKTHGNPKDVSSTTTSPATDSPTTPTTTTTLNPIAQKISSKPNLLAKLQSLVPGGMTLDQLNLASQGFKNQGQFIAALHVSHNLHIPFWQLRRQMVVEHKSLGQAIQTFPHSSNPETAVAHAQRQASADLSDK